MKCRSLRSGRVFDAVWVDGELLVTVLEPGPSDDCPVGTTFVLNHDDVKWLRDGG